MTEKKVALICLDVDGTLVGEQPEIHPRVWEAAKMAQEAGIALSICTGRPGIGPTRGYAETLDPEGWHIFQGGASIYQVGTGQEHAHYLSETQLQALYAQQKENQWVLELYSSTDFICETQPHEPGYQLAVDHAHLIGLTHTPRAKSDLQGAIVRAQWVVTDAQFEKVMASAPAGLNYASATSPSVPGVHFISVTPEGVNKCSAIQHLAEQIIGTDLAHTMMVGDGQNDLSALEMVGYPVAMENADPVLRKVARYRAGHVEDGGAAEAILLAIRLNSDSAALLD